MAPNWDLKRLTSGNKDDKNTKHAKTSPESKPAARNKLTAENKDKYQVIEMLTKDRGFRELLMLVL